MTNIEWTSLGLNDNQKNLLKEINEKATLLGRISSGRAYAIAGLIGELSNVEHSQVITQIYLGEKLTALGFNFESEEEPWGDEDEDGGVDNKGDGNS